MKKHDEGYVMILVLVVMIVMGLVTASILTFSLRNLQNQQLSIERMADKYAAQGMIEEYLSNPPQENNQEGTISKVHIINKNEEYFSDGLSGEEKPKDYLAAKLAEKTVEEGQARAGSVSAVIVELMVKQGSALITCKLEVSGDFITGETAAGYIITNPEITYTSYKITYSNGETEEEVPAT